MADAIDYFSLRHPLRSLASKVALGARHKMYALFVELLDPQPSDLVLDIGVTPDTSLPDSNFFEKLYPHPENITATSIEDASNLLEEFPGIKFVRTQSSGLPFADKEFDIVFCSAVLEHVGDRAQQQHFIEELTRVSKRFFVTTPNRGFPIEVHTFIPLIHWLPQRIHQRILRILGLEFWAKTANLNLLSGGSMLALFPKSSKPKLRKNRLLGFASNLIAYGES